MTTHTESPDVLRARVHVDAYGAIWRGDGECLGSPLRDELVEAYRRHLYAADHPNGCALCAELAGNLLATLDAERSRGGWAMTVTNPEAARRVVRVEAWTDGMNVLIIGAPPPAGGERKEYAVPTIQIAVGKDHRTVCETVHDCAVMGCISPGHVVARGQITQADDWPSRWMARAESGARVYVPQDDRASWQRCPAMVRNSIDAYVSDGLPTGPFLRSVLENDLCAAFGRADDDSLPLLPNIVNYVYETVPNNIFGTPAKVEAHLTEKRKQREAALEVDR